VVLPIATTAAKGMGSCSWLLRAVLLAHRGNIERVLGKMHGNKLDVLFKQARSKATANEMIQHKPK
jgi:hypothetical protein